MATNGQLVLVFDDGAAADYETVRPVLGSAGVPACFAIVPAWIGTPGSLDAGRLRELADAGHEIAAHGRRHRYLQAHGLSRDAAGGDERLHVEGDVFPDEDHGVVAGDRYEVVDEDGTETVELAGKGESGGDPYVDLAAGLDASYAAGETLLRPAAGVLREEIVGAQDALREFGLDPRTFVLPYDAGDLRAWSIVERRYDALANAAIRSLPNPPGTPLTNLRRYYLETTHLTGVGIDEYLDAVAERDAIGVLAGHSAWDSVPAERVARVVDGALDRGIEVTTFRGLAGRGR